MCQYIIVIRRYLYKVLASNIKVELGMLYKILTSTTSMLRHVTAENNKTNDLQANQMTRI